MDGQTDEIRSHYHFVYEKKIPRGVIKIDINALAPRSDIAKAFEDINEWFRKDCRTQDEEERVDGIRHRQSACSKKFCEMFLKKCLADNICADVMAELNEWARVLIRLEKIDDLPDIDPMKKIVIAFQKPLETFVDAYGGLAGGEAAFLISDGVRNYSNLLRLLIRMKAQETSHS